MKIAIIGGGFTGLAAGVELVDRGAQVTIFEAEKRTGGLAIGFSDSGWEWSLERYYHHIFYGDEAIRELAEKVGLPAFFQIPKTNSFIGGAEYELDSPSSLLKFPKLSLRAKIHTGLGLALIKTLGRGVFLERYRAVKVLPWLLGKEGYVKIWGPLMRAKFGGYADEVNMAWFWGRVNKRTQRLGYFPGGFAALASRMVEYIKERGGVVRLATKVSEVKKDKVGRWWVNGEVFDKVLLTVPAPLIEKILGEPVVSFPRINYLEAQTLVLELDHSLMEGYWLNILEKDWPFLVAVEQTNFIDMKHYGNRTILYLGNYLTKGDKRLSMDERKLIDLFAPYLTMINSRFDRKWVKKSWLFETAYAQPVFPTNYSRLLPPIKSDQPGLFIANMSMVYPWDRGTNFAVELGLLAAKTMKNGG